jgi:hypothetical protein
VNNAEMSRRDSSDDVFDRISVYAGLQGIPMESLGLFSIKG